jgi:hypothetical protein
VCVFACVFVCVYGVLVCVFVGVVVCFRLCVCVRVCVRACVLVCARVRASQRTADGFKIIGYMVMAVSCTTFFIRTNVYGRSSMLPWSFRITHGYTPTHE